MTQTGRRYQTAASSKHPAPLKSKPSPSFLAISVFATGAFLGTPPAYSHPHIFVDGGVDFRFENGTLLDALEVT